MEKGKTERISYDDNVVIVPVELCRDEEVEGEAIAVYTVMKSFGPVVTASLGAIAYRLKWGPDRVAKYQEQLETARWIHLIREGSNKEPRHWWACRKKGQKPEVPIIKAFWKEQEIEKKVKKQGGQFQGGEIQGGGFQGGEITPPNQHKDSIKRSKKHTYTYDFEQAWGLYDKGNKAEAFAEWNRLGEDGPDVGLFITILEAVDWQSQTAEWYDDGGKFRKDFCRWLKFRGWEKKKPADFKPFKNGEGEGPGYKKVGGVAL